MKKSCSLLLLCWIGIGVAEFMMLRDTQFAEQYWIPILLSLSTAIVLANVEGLIKILRQFAASKRTPQQWKDGDLVTISGKVHALRQPFAAPFSGKKAVIVEYQINSVASGNKTAGAADFSGLIMTPCAIQTTRGSIKLVGFPLIAHIAGEEVDSQAAYLNAAKYLVNAKFRDRPTNITDILKEYSELLSDDDGDLKVDFKDPAISLSDFTAQASSLSESEFGEPADQLEALPSSGGPEADAIARYLMNRGVYLEETVIPNGAEITVSGTYSANRQAINIGSGFKNLVHELYFGPHEKVLGKRIRKTFISLLFWLAVSGGAHLYVGSQIGVIPPDAIPQWMALKWQDMRM